MSKAYLNNATFFKSNYDEAIKIITPKYLLEEDLANFDSSIDIEDEIINSHIDVANNFSSILNVSSQPGTIYSSITTFSSIANYFIKQNNLSVIRPEFFERKVLDVLGTSFSNFDTSSELDTYLEETLLPSITLNRPSSSFTHSGLIKDLSWLYFLNTSGTSYNPSSYVKSLITDKLYTGSTLYLNDFLKGLSEYIWKNGLTNYYPDSFASGTTTYLSGTQALDNLKTWIDILYSPLYADSGNFKVKEKFELYLTTGLKEENQLSQGPITKLLRLIGFAAFDSNNDTELIESLYSIDDCPDEYLPYIADLIGWRLFGSNPERWRLQLRNAVEVYKRVGTKKSLQFALNTVFPKDIFSIESRITELWESYIPYLIYYSLATESSFFETQSTWTNRLASQLGVNAYSVSSLDENIRLTTDKILLDTYNKFKSSFNIPNKTNKFYYRGRRFDIPPFEEYPYYVNVELSNEMVDFIVDRLVCFGVRQDFALQVENYIKSNTLEVDDEIRSSSWLFFTSGYNSPPNLDNLVLNPNKDKINYASLWSGKSSHFKLIFNADEFDFTNKDENDIESGDAVLIATDIVNEFSPAHSIPLISLQLSSVDTQYTSDTNLPIVSVKNQESLETFNRASNYQTSGLSLNAYTRNNTSGNKFSRGSLTNLDSAFIVSKTSIGSIPRNSIRRRSYEKIMPMEGYFDRTGFNMPVSFDPSASLSGFPLGFIPSSLSFADITDWKNLPLIYQTCINSSSNLYGYPVSSTLKCRGHLPLEGNNYCMDRGMLADIYGVMHTLEEQKKWYSASSITSATLLELSWKDVYQSYANSYTASSNWFPSAVSNYYNFKFGRDLHELYKVYTSQFDRHRLSEDLHYLDGPNIFSHTFGPILYNHDFYLTNPIYTTSSIGTASSFVAGLGPFSVLNGAYVVSAASSVKLFTNEFVTSSAVYGVELVIPSGTTNSYIGIFKEPGSEKPSYASDYMYDNTFLILGGDSRIRFDLRAPNLNSSDGYPISKNFLLPDYNYTLNLKYSIVSKDGTTFGGSPIGVWIHTKPENSKIWSYTKNGTWVQHSYDLSSTNKVEFLANYTHYLGYNELTKQFNTSDTGKRFQCIDLVESPTQLSRIALIDEADFVESQIKFNTFNKDILFDRTYGITYGSVHRKTQDYVIEIIHYGTDKDLILDKVELINSTLNTMSQFLALETCPEIRIPLTKEQLQVIFKYFNDIAGKNSAYGMASRVVTETSGVFSVSGGSRLDYRIHSDSCGTATGLSKYSTGNVVIQEVELPV